MKKYICLRDDDASFITKVEDLSDAYDCYWNVLPVTLATVPFSHGSQQLILSCEDHPNKYGAVYDWEKKASADQLTVYHRTHPIGENRELVEYLKPMIRNGKVEIAQHGVNHRYHQRGPEMLSDQHNCYTIRAGKEYLEKVFDIDVVTFVPPSNYVDRKIVRILAKLGLHLFDSGSIHYNSSLERLYNICCDIPGLCEKINQSIRHETRPIVRRCGTYIFGSPTFDKWRTVDEMYGYVINNLEKTCFSGLGTHYMLFSDMEYKKKYLQLLDRLTQQPEIEFVTAKKYFELLMKKYYD